METYNNYMIILCIYKTAAAVKIVNLSHYSAKGKIT